MHTPSKTKIMIDFQCKEHKRCPTGTKTKSISCLQTPVIKYVNIQTPMVQQAIQGAKVESST